MAAVAVRLVDLVGTADRHPTTDRSTGLGRQPGGRHRRAVRGRSASATRAGWSYPAGLPSHCSASMAAAHPEPAAVIAWR